MNAKNKQILTNAKKKKTQQTLVDAITSMNAKNDFDE